MLSNLRRWPLLACLSLLSLQANAESGRTDYDLDDDGLIEINDLADLDEIRNHLDGTALYGENTGCPDEGCNGFELTTDLDFDTNGDGQMDEKDTYWNDGSGWVPIGTSSNPFTAIVNGNGFSIRNLYINYSSYRVGLFGQASDSELTNLVLTGPLTSVTAVAEIGILSGKLINSSVSQIYVSGIVSASAVWSDVGGVAGTIHSTSLQNVHSAAAVKGRERTGGVIGYVTYDSRVSQVLATGVVKGKGTSRQGGLAGSGTGLSDTDISNSYWALDSTSQESSYKLSSDNSYIGSTLAELQCPSSADNNTCVTNTTIYSGWNSEFWDFGTSEQLPALKINGRIIRDSDGDGALDEEDAFPDNFVISIDKDQDGYADRLTNGCDESCFELEGTILIDAFPSQAAAWEDNDLDGLPDSWAEGCDSACIQKSWLKPDEYLNDSDNDGQTNDLDIDDNNDGVIDADSDSDGLIDIHTLDQLNAMRFNLSGTGRVVNQNAEIDSSGCPSIIVNGIYEEACIGYELMADLDFDTNSDGQMNELDTYWNTGAGWVPIGTSSRRFTAIFNGNGFSIRNLYIASTSSDLGLFGRASNSTFKNLVLTGPLTQIYGSSSIGLLSGYLVDSFVSHIYVSGFIYASDPSGWVGGITGSVTRTSLENIHSAVAFGGAGKPGGIVGTIYPGSEITQVLATGVITGTGGGISKSGGTGISDSYWATDSTTQPNSSNANSSKNYFGATLAELQCPTENNDTYCISDGTLYAEWNADTWDFGTPEQLPALKINGRTIRDSDGDGTHDDEDAFPFNFSASVDNDRDGSPDQLTNGCDNSCLHADSLLPLDAFPENAAAWHDDDLDGLPDSWAENCDMNCQENSGLVLDRNLNDSDNDGLTNDIDPDDNNDGITDADADSDGLIDIYTLEQLNAMRFDLYGTARVSSDATTRDASGCPFVIVNGTYSASCNGYELMTDLDFDTNNDGLLNEQDNYWNYGQGWSPIGSYSGYFSAIFNGNGFEIRNLYINSSSSHIGLFGQTENAELTNVVFTGPLTQVSGSSSVGILSGTLISSSVSNIYVSGSVSASNTNGFIGGVAGRVDRTSLQNIQSAARVEGIERTGGVAGFVYTDSNISYILATGLVIGQDAGSNGGIAGSLTSSTISNSHWASDSTNQKNSNGSDVNDRYSGAPLGVLQCPSSNDDSTCSLTSTLYTSWSNDVWDFGTSEQLPALKINGRIIRDSDGDGILDDEDPYPHLHGITDTDGDSHVDSTSPGCDETCLKNANLMLDHFPEDPNEWLDTDEDGTGNNADLDDDNDGYSDSVEIEENSDPLSADSRPADLDGDYIPDSTDDDIDGDGYLNENDAFQRDASEWVDTDSDNIGNNADTDDDNDGYSDSVEIAENSDPLSASSRPRDLDRDFIPDSTDNDIDGDGYLNLNDAFPYNVAEWLDTDADGTGNNADTDDDNDGYSDSVEVAENSDPLSAESRPEDIDSDFIPDSTDDDIDGDGYLNANDALPRDASEWIDTDSDSIGNNADTDDDNDGYSDTVEIEEDSDPLNADSRPADLDGDFIPDSTDDDIDGDGYLNANDAFQWDASEWIDTDTDGTGNNADSDDDNDGYSDATEVVENSDPLSAESRPEDMDSDFIPDSTDDDIDGDGYLNANDAFPRNASEWLDTDSDNIGNNTDSDDDNDGYSDTVEIEEDSDPLNAGSRPADLDGDFIPDSTDDDIDGDGYPNATDSFPRDSSEWIDTDGDTIGNNADNDDDNDGYLDSIEIAEKTDPLSKLSRPKDLDGDFIPDSTDDDIDGDSYLNANDAFPRDASEWLDTDSDSIGNNADLDDDNDGYSDKIESSENSDPLNADSRPADLDGDFIPDSTDDDIDGDGYLNAQDTFPRDSSEWKDTDGDTIGNNADTDDDNDGYSDTVEVSERTDPLNADSRPADLDNDFIPDSTDDDIDGDSYLNVNDAFPRNAQEWLDTDLDGTGNNADIDDDNDGYSDADELDGDSDPLDANSRPGDLDGDLIPDISDDDIDGDSYLNESDVFPRDPTEWIDTDLDGTGDNADTDDDNDGYSDAVEIEEESDPLNTDSRPADLDSDFIPDSTDDDIDGDGYLNTNDVFPRDAAEWQDTDADNIGNNTDTDDDNDGYSDTVEVAENSDPLSAESRPADMDSDFIPDSVDDDADGDGYLNAIDAFPENVNEWLDSDGDGTGNNADPDDDNDGYNDTVELAEESDPLASNSTPDDLDGDFEPDSTDPDIDNDGVGNESDAFPYLYYASLDNDGDGYAEEFHVDCDMECRVIHQDIFDQFPDSPAAGADRDLDGMPESWAENCNDDCQILSGMILDFSPDDFDNDGLTDDEDTDDDNNGQQDVDADSNGLLDIAALSSLDAMRHNLNGSAMKLSSESEGDDMGCPVVFTGDNFIRRCHGYELRDNLDFDTNSDGSINKEDAFWNDGKGWQPIGANAVAPFAAVFEGNGYMINNLHINRPATDIVGLFGYLNGGDVQINRLALITSPEGVTGRNYTGVLAGYSVGASINTAYVSGTVEGTSNVGIAIGRINSTDLMNVFVSGEVVAVQSEGSLTGSSYGGSINSVLASVIVNGNQPGSLLGQADNTSVSQSYWVGSNDYSVTVAYEATAFGASLEELQCPENTSMSDCLTNGKSLYENWDFDVWDFGTYKQLPGIIMGDTIYRDSTGNGAIDENHPPSLTLRITQGGKDVTQVMVNSGDVTIEAYVLDEDTQDIHTINWTSDDVDMGNSYELGNSLTFSSNNLIEGEYTINATVTDSGLPQMSASGTLLVEVIPYNAPATEPEELPEPSAPAPEAGGSSGGGSAFWLLLLSAAPLVSWRRHQVRA